jgi:type IV pilus assembly protein PilN
VIRLNLLPVRELNAESDRRRDLLVAAISLAATTLILVGVYLYQSAQLSNLANELPVIRKEVEVLNGKVKELGNLEAKLKELKSKHKVIEDLRGQKTGPTLVMDSLAAATPSSLWLVELKQSGGRLIMNGLAMDNQSVAEFIRSLSQSGHFKDVELVETTQADPKTGPYKKFSIQSAISYAAPTTGSPAPTQVGANGDKS